MTKMEFASMLAEEAKKGGIDAEEDYIFRADGTYIAVILKTEPGIPAPRIPVDGLFEALESGMPLEKVKADFVEKAKIANEMTLNGVNEKVLDWGWVKERVILRLVPTDREEVYLAGCVHRMIADLAVVCSILITEDTATTATPSLLDAWEITEDELFQTAKGKTGPVLSGIEDAIGIAGTGPCGMAVLTSRQLRFGAGAVLCDGIQEKLDAIYPGGFYLLPSSIHEWLVVGKDNDQDWLKRMVQDTNRTVLCPEDVLSDNVYTLERGVLKVVC